jgi:bacterioferritin (cytochrome b1)
VSKVIVPTQPLGERPYRGLSVHESAALLRRYHQIERACMRAALAWMLEAPRYEDKYAIGYHLWDHAEHVNWIRERLSELRGGHPDANADPTMQLVLDETLHARSTAELAAGLYLGVKAALVEQYREHLRLADPSANAVEVRLIERIIPDLERHISWAKEVLEREADGGEEAGVWGSYIASRLAHSGGVSGYAPLPLDSLVERPHAFYLPRPSAIKFDSRIRHAPLASYQDRDGMPIEQEVKEQFRVFFNEWWAAGLLATVLFDAWEARAPWEFYYELSHHCWDEVRHSEFGWIRLKELGEQPETVNLVLFEQAVNWPILHRLVYLTLDMEAYFMARKRPRVLRYQEAREDRSLIFADVDWSDEINHVRYGKRWTDHFLEDDLRTAEDIKQEVAVLIERQTRRPRESEKSPF